MTYRELLDRLKGFSKEELDLDIAVYLFGMDEYFQVEGIMQCDDGVLDDGHPFLVVRDDEGCEYEVNAIGNLRCVTNQHNHT